MAGDHPTDHGYARIAGLAEVQPRIGSVKRRENIIRTAPRATASCHMTAPRRPVRLDIATSAAWSAVSEASWADPCTSAAKVLCCLPAKLRSRAGYAA